jgi:DNA-binding NarL/FixJ family response regulator
MKTAAPITVLVAEDHNVVREGLCSLLTTDGRFRVVGQARNGRAAVDMALTLHPDVILMDLSMPLLNGVEATGQILAAIPTARIVILSAHSGDEYVDQLIATGVLGFLVKDTSAKMLLRAVWDAAQGTASFSASIVKRRRDAQLRTQSRDGLCKVTLTNLTAREREVLQLVAEGLANKQCAAELKVSIKTIEKHRQSLMDKLDIHNTAGLTRHAISAGMIDIGAKLTVT